MEGGGARRSGRERKEADAEAGTLTQLTPPPNQPHFTTVRGWNLNSLGLTPLTVSTAGYDVEHDLFYFVLLTNFSIFENWSNLQPEDK